MLDDSREQWTSHILSLILIAAAVRILVNSLTLMPLHFDEAQYWTYGEELDLGYYSKPPLAAWLIRVSTEIFGDTEFGVRFFPPLIHGWIAWQLIATGRRLFDARAGFWAGAVYLTLPGVTVSAGVMSTDPPMMAAWAAALYALVRALQATQDGKSGL
ncbi:MAG: glycosyltransferase family 39 protein, partial [Pseudomonadota bacterium]